MILKFLPFAIFIILFLSFKNKILKKFNLYDLPDGKRKLHLYATPLFGGTLVFLNIIIYLFFIFFFYGISELTSIFFINSEKNFLSFIFILSAIYFFGYIDDSINLKPSIKIYFYLFLFFFLVYQNQTLYMNDLIFSFLDNSINVKKTAMFVSVFYFLVFVIVMNLYDGVNLQSSIFYLIGFFFIILITKNYWLIFLVILPILIFSFLNYKNEMFLGETGTNVLAFLLSFFLVKIYNHHSYDLIKLDSFLLILFFPLIDALRLFASRVYSKKNPFSPDRKHLHHILMNLFGYNKTIFILALLTLISFTAVYFKINFFISFIFFSLIYYLIVFKTKNNNFYTNQ